MFYYALDHTTGACSLIFVDSTKVLTGRRTNFELSLHLGIALLSTDAMHRVMNELWWHGHPMFLRYHLGLLTGVLGDLGSIQPGGVNLT